MVDLPITNVIYYLKENIMGLFQDLQDEQQRIVIAKLTGQPLDFSRLREIATEFNEQSDEGLEVTGSDQELWRSITMYFRNLLKK